MSEQASDLVISVEPEPAEAAREAVLNGLRAYNRRHAEAPDFQPLVLAARDGDAVIGGLVGMIGWRWLYVDLLWVADEYRGVRLGRRLLQTAEQEAWVRGARHAYLDTFDFQAKPFYERQGYTLFGTLDGYPPGHSRYFLQKALAPATNDRPSNVR
jgi:GNAT superfamily N-acetyltransferase